MLLAKIREQMERAEHLIGLLPAGRLDWAPEVRGAWSARVLLEHLRDCLAGFCAVLHAAQPARLAHFSKLREIQPSMAEYRAHIEEGFAALTDSDLARRVPTIFVRAGEPVLTLLLGNLEHLINHKHQLFTYLRLMGVEAGTPDLYRLRGE